MARREAQHSTKTGFRIREEEPVLLRELTVAIGKQRGEVIVENIDGLIIGIALAIGAQFSRAKIAARLASRQGFSG